MSRKTTKKRKTISRRQQKPSGFRIARSRTGLGLFAAAPIRRGAFIVEYTGERFHGTDLDSINKWNKYLFEVNRRCWIDGSPRSNTARYINHSCKPNAVPYEGGGRIRIYARRLIHPGEEITYDYGREYFDDILKPIGCKCVACTDGRKHKRSKRNGRHR